jgi:hypothetical protein
MPTHNESTPSQSPRRTRRLAVVVPDTEQDHALLADLSARSGWKVTGRSRTADGHLAVVVRVPNNATQYYSKPELRSRGWVLTSAPRTEADSKGKTTTGRRWPRPIPTKHMPMFGTPASARQCAGCRSWYSINIMWNPTTRSFSRWCPRCAWHRRPRPGPVTIRQGA